MMTVEVSNDNLDIKLTGSDRFMALKKELSIPLAHITSVEVASAPHMGLITLGKIGSRWPGRFTVGSFRTHEGWSFWNVRKGERVLVVEVEGERYKRLVLEVDDPEGLVEMVKRRMG